jgi:hypothetical protein
LLVDALLVAAMGALQSAAYGVHREREGVEMSEPRELIEECRAALAEELAAWDIDPPLHHVKQAHDKCVAWLAENPPTGKEKE